MQVLNGNILIIETDLLQDYMEHLEQIMVTMGSGYLAISGATYSTNYQCKDYYRGYNNYMEHQFMAIEETIATKTIELQLSKKFILYINCKMQTYLQ